MVGAKVRLFPQTLLVVLTTVLCYRMHCDNGCGFDILMLIFHILAFSSVTNASSASAA